MLGTSLPLPTSSCAPLDCVTLIKHNTSDLTMCFEVQFNRFTFGSSKPVSETGYTCKSSSLKTAFPAVTIHNAFGEECLVHTYESAPRRSRRWRFPESDISYTWRPSFIAGSLRHLNTRDTMVTLQRKRSQTLSAAFETMCPLRGTLQEGVLLSGC